MVSSGERTDEVASNKLQKGQSPDNEIHVSQNQEEVTSVTLEKSLQDPDVSAGVRISQLDKEGSISSIILGKVSQTPGTSSSVTQSGPEERSILREKVTEDGYHWRKYGQKLVKGNEFIRSYYKCTHPNCQVKKQLERSHNGQVVDIVYFGPHNHPKPANNVPLAVGFVLSVVEDRASQPLSTSKQEDHVNQLPKSKSNSQISTVASSEDVKGVLSESTRIRDEVDNDDDLQSKRQKKGSHNVEPTSVDKPSGEPRLVVQTLSEVDIVNDGYRWRKYGQKLVKGNPNPRSYYRCSSPGCPVKKHVERASHDSKVVITSYEGEHDHEMPPSRTVTHNPTGVNIYTTAVHSGELGAKSGGSNGVVHNLGSSRNSKEQPSESRNKFKGSHVSGSEIVIFSGSGQDNKLNQLQNGKSIATEGSDTAGMDKHTVVNTSSVPQGRSNEQHDGESRTEPKVNYSACSVRTITPNAESNPNEKHIPNAEPVQS
ncbi:WRKY transcription factor 1 isoform X2 [Ricinus communis]|uniref:WRKY transcription factor, putative n=1 Tax=Ricinus communis TaxID=3988 RepID=B9T6K0_RICCO|nr:WRKY transcription factor 1 isoform X2 [Ricinus communis]EEF28519.1 WRKY transcription factor, putative [Ricinus communis]|eukprot:XP_002533869.1 WRKY transcription factor 1 [Ricinus communis]